MYGEIAAILTTVSFALSYVLVRKIEDEASPIFQNATFNSWIFNFLYDLFNFWHPSKDIHTSSKSYISTYCEYFI